MRNLKRSDIPRIETMLNRLHEAGAFTKEEVACALELLLIVVEQPGQKDYLVLVAETSSAVAGYILYGPIPLTSGNYAIYWIAADPHISGQGFGRRLLQAAERDMSQRGARMICLETASKASYCRTRAFYEHAGYRQEAAIADFYVPGDDMLTYVKRFS